MIDKIENIEDVKLFFTELFNEGVSAHPDDDFNDYVNYETKEPTYRLEEAALRNQLMESSFIVCETSEIDIYEVMSEIFSKKNKRT